MGKHTASDSTSSVEDLKRRLQEEKDQIDAQLRAHLKRTEKS